MQVMSLMTNGKATVVQNVKSSEYLELPKAPLSEAKSLLDIEAQRQNWETTAYRTSNQQLYAVLAACLEYGKKMEVIEAKQRSSELEAFFKQRGYVYKKDSPLLTRIVKAVFGELDRRRLSTYSIVLRTAQSEEVKPENLASWIEKNRGIQEIKMARSNTYVSPKQKADTAKSSFSNLPNLAVAKERLAEIADAQFIGSECVLLAEQQADGSFHIKALTRSGGAVTAAMTALYGEQQKASA